MVRSPRQLDLSKLVKSDLTFTGNTKINHKNYSSAFPLPFWIIYTLKAKAIGL
jgi:hypothetical protein